MSVKHEKYQRLIDYCKTLAADAHGGRAPVRPQLARGRGARRRRLGLIAPILVGPRAKHRGRGEGRRRRHLGIPIVDAPHSHAAAEAGVRLVREGKAEALMKGSLHTDELMAAVVRRETGLRTARRISHCFVMDVPRLRARADHHRRRGQHRAHARGEGRHPAERDRPRARAAASTEVRVAILSAMETVNPKVPSTIEAAALCKMVDRHQITGGAGRRPARARQRDQPRGRRDQEDRLAGRRARQRADGARPRVGQHAGQEPLVPGRRRRRRHRARRARADHPHQPRRFADDAARVVRGCRAGRQVRAAKARNADRLTHGRR